MIDILVQPLELRQISERLRISAQKIGTALQAIDNDILSLKGDKFLGNRANAVQVHYAPKREALLNAKDMVLHFADDLQSVANVFEQADKSGDERATEPSIPGVPIQPQPGNNDPFEPIIDLITGPEVKIGLKIGEVLDKILSENPIWAKIFGGAGDVLSILSSSKLYYDLFSEDIQKYSTLAEQEAAFIVDALFTLAIFELKSVTAAAGTVLIVDGLKCALLGFFVGPALVTAALGVVTWGGGWAAAEGIKAVISNDSIRDAIIQSVAKGLSQQTPALQSVPAY